MFLSRIKIIYKKVFWHIKITGENICLNDSNISLHAEIICKNAGGIKIGNKVSISSGCRIQSIGGIIQIGDNVFVNKGCFIVGRKSIMIGDNCTLGPNVLIYDHDHGIHKEERNVYTVKDVIIGNDVWIGANCIILKGTEIGNGCVIGAGTIVKGKIPDNCILTSEVNYKMRPIMR